MKTQMQKLKALCNSQLARTGRKNKEMTVILQFGQIILAIVKKKL